MRGSYNNFILDAGCNHGLLQSVFQSDLIHANDYGEEILQTTVATFFLPDPVPNPEPGSAMLLTLAAGGLLMRRRHG
jgi:hypothetical protein